MVFTRNTRSRIPYTLYPVLRKRISFLSVKEVYESVIDSFRTNQRQVTNKVYSDVWSGIYIINNHLFVSKNGKILCFQLYMDVVSCTWMKLKWLGQEGLKGKQKFCVFYWVLLNLSPLLRSCFRSIQLLINSDLVKRCGVETFLRPILDELAKFIKCD